MRWRCTTKAILFEVVLLFSGLQGCSARPTIESSPLVSINPTPALETTITATIRLPAIEVEDDPFTPTPLPTETALPIKENEPDRLVEAAKKFAATTPEQVRSVLVRIGEVDASNIDGPLTLAILKQAGELGHNFNPHLFWLLDPVQDSKALEQVFPREDYAWRRLDGAINAMDYSEEKLFPGDFIYLIPVNPKKIGKSLVVTRIDQEGRMFSTTNIYDPQTGEYFIAEIELYGPDQKSSGFFAKYSSMYKGMLVVHRRNFGDQRQEQIALEKVLNRGGIWQVMVQPIGGAPIFILNESEIVHPASMIKVPLGMLVMKYLLSQTSDLPQALESAPPEAGRTYEQLLRAMLVLSEETATGLLEQDLRVKMGDQTIRSTLDEWGAINTALEPRRSTASEITRLWEGLYTRQILGDQASTILLNYLAEVTAGDRVRLWKLGDLLPEGARIYNKRGSLTRPVIVADSGIITLPDGRAYILCLIGEPDDWTSFEDLEDIIGDFAFTWYRQLLQASESP